MGGCIRDSLLGRTPNDWDITTSAKPQEVRSFFSHTVDTGIQHGTVTVMVDHEGYEVTTYRIDGEYEDARHPKEVSFTSDLLEDLRRRDFTINAMAYNDTNGLVDAYQGEQDLAKGRIRCVGDARQRFQEDALRMMRAVRFSAQLGFSIEEETRQAIRELAPTIGKVSAERIQAELVKLLVSPHPQQLKDAWELGLTAVFLPEWDEMMHTKQNTKHHQYTVGEHTLHAMQAIRADKVLRLSMCLHDVAKPPCRTVDEKTGADHFYGHPKKGALLAEQILRRLKFDNETIRRVCRFVEFHDDRPALREKNIRRAISTIGLEFYPELFEIKRADTLAQSLYQREEKLAYIDEYQRIYEQILETKQCVCKKDLAIGGKELMALGMKPGKNMGQMMDWLYEQVLEEPEKNTKEDLCELALQRLKEQEECGEEE